VHERWRWPLVRPGTTQVTAPVSTKVHCVVFEVLQDELPGLAHFCEHMVFLGSEKVCCPR
jgi:Zn-dependent M16 (insulinase) family peptidase